MIGLAGEGGSATVGLDDGFDEAETETEPAEAS